MDSPAPAKLSNRDARYLNMYEKPLGRELKKKFGSSDGFSIAEASERLNCVEFLHYTTRYDVVGAVVRFMLYSGKLEKNGRKFRFVKKSRTGRIGKPNGHAKH